MHIIVHNKLIAGINLMPAILLSWVIVFNSCTPRDAESLYLGGTFQIKAKILNQQDSLNLGDSLKVVFEIPDTILLNNVSTVLTDKISCEMGEGIAIADSTRPGGFTNPVFNNTCKIYVNPGTINSNNVFRLSKVGNKLLGTYYMIPTKKGVFFLLSETPGYFEGNSTTGKIKCRIVFDFDVANKHHNLLQPAIGVNNNLTPMINSMAANGQGLYVFAVK
jgi:hypothetical protein